VATTPAAARVSQEEVEVEIYKQPTVLRITAVLSERLVVSDA
jgi:hypothetical protein